MCPGWFIILLEIECHKDYENRQHTTGPTLPPEGQTVPLPPLTLL